MSKEKLPIISPDSLAGLNSIYFEITEKVVELDELQLRFKKLMMSEMKKFNKHIENNLICLNCGLVFNKNSKTGCPACNRKES